MNNNISILIVDDDVPKISVIIKTIKEIYSETLSISQASSVNEAIENLQQKEFHLLITDFQMPLRNDELPDDKGGETLIRSLYKKKTNANVPMYIVGLTQFENLRNAYRGVWKIWNFNSSQEEWKVNLRDLIHHISLVKSRVLTEKIETIYTEGPTDKLILETAIKHFYFDLRHKFQIETINYGGGAAWIERQIFIWSKTLTKRKDTGEYLKSIGIFDSDEAGLKAVRNIRNIISNDSAEAKTFGIVFASFKYSAILKSIKSKGITFPTTIEDLATPELIYSAKLNNWLIKRKLETIIIDKTILPINEIDEDMLRKYNFTEDEILIILFKVNDQFKTQFSNHWKSIECDSFIYIKYLLKEVFTKLKLS